MAETVVSSAHLPQSLLLGIEAAGVALLLLALLLARPRWVVPAIVAVAFPAGAALSLRGPAQLAPILGAVLLAAAELAYWSIERATPARESFDVGLFRGVWMVGLCLAGCGAGLLVSAVSDLPVSGGFDLTAMGIVAAVAISFGLLWLGRDALRSRVSAGR
ncbi:MAG TPA: hypothetical protein VMW80_14080 [Candidatus Dormibacteraeota bacterium]|nr:hypothetical protein [Candidatus Dormibacteraeota bacterium]